MTNPTNPPFYVFDVDLCGCDALVRIVDTWEKAKQSAIELKNAEIAIVDKDRVRKIAYLQDGHKWYYEPEAPGNICKYRAGQNVLYWDDEDEKKRAGVIEGVLVDEDEYNLVPEIVYCISDLLIDEKDILRVIEE